MAKRFPKHQIDVLKSAFEESQHPTKEKKLQLALLTGLDMEQITSWFNRQRVRIRLKESKGNLEHTNARLQRTLVEGEEREAELLNELQQSRKREAELHNELRETKRRQLEVMAANQRLKQQLTCACGSDPLGDLLLGALVPKRGNKW